MKFNFNLKSYLCKLGLHKWVATWRRHGHYNTVRCARCGKHMPRMEQA